MITTTTEWPTGPVKLEWHPTEHIDVPLTGSHGFIFGENGVLVVNVRSRGYTVPGGHIEAGETPTECLLRETREEAYAVITGLIQLGFVISDHSENPAFSGPYPVRSAQALFTARIAELCPFRPSAEISDRVEVAIDELPRLHHEWNDVLAAAFGMARDLVSAA